MLFCVRRGPAAANPCRRCASLWPAAARAAISLPPAAERHPQRAALYLILLARSLSPSLSCSSRSCKSLDQRVWCFVLGGQATRMGSHSCIASSVSDCGGGRALPLCAHAAAPIKPTARATGSLKQHTTLLFKRIRLSPIIRLTIQCTRTPKRRQERLGSNAKTAVSAAREVRIAPTSCQQVSPDCATRVALCRK